MAKNSVKRSILYFVSSIFMGLLAGIIWFYTTLELEKNLSQIENGPWFTSELYGASAADAQTRANIALTGLFALGKKETIYYTAVTDSSGEALVSNCSYQVIGNPFAAGWWSITLYGPDHFLVANEINRYAFNMRNLQMNADGSFTIQISRDKKDLNWLPSSTKSLEGSKFSLTLRLYNPAQEIHDNLSATPLPVIEKGECA